MRTKGTNPHELAGPGVDAPDSAVLSAYLQTMQLKRLYRQGWLKRDISEASCESVADHSFGVCLLALLLAGDGLDRDKAIRMALVHELGEVYAGDITPVDGVSPEEKHALERASLERVIEGLANADELRALWNEFESGGTPEAGFVRELDRLEMGIQAAVYHAEGSERMEEFYESADRAVRSERLRAVLEDAKRRARNA